MNLSLQYSFARELLWEVASAEETWKLRGRVPGPEHPDTLRSRNNLAEAYRAVGRDREAESRFNDE